jgi:hypothetical protein
MDAAKPGLVAEPLEGPFRLHAQIAGIGPHVARDEPGTLERAHVAVLDRRDVGRANAQLPLHVQKRLAQRRALPAHQVAERNVHHVVAIELG